MRNVEITSREMQIAAGVALGYANKQISDRVCLSEKTVKNHITNLFNKIEGRDGRRVESRGEAVFYLLVAKRLPLDEIELERILSTHPETLEYVPCRAA